MSIRDFLLNKAVRDLSRLVKVKRLRQTKNGVVPAYVWVRPSQILKTDVIVQNAHNAVSLGNGLYAPAKGVWDRRYFASLAKTDKKKAMEYAQSLGITWVRDSNAGKDWLRAFKAVKDYSKPHTQIQTPTAPQATIQPTPTPKVTKPKAQTPTATQQTIATVVLDKKQVDEINNEQNARRKVVILTHYLGQDGAKDYAKQIGLTWKDDPNDASLTWRRVRRALRHKFESGYQVVATVTPTQPTAQTAQTAQTAPTATPAPKAKATKAKTAKAKTATPKADKPKDVQPTADTTAQDTAKEEPKKETEAPKVDESLLEIDPTKMTQREQNIANLLNKCTDAEALKIFAKAGIVGEDDQATAFVKKQLYEGYYMPQANTYAYAEATAKKFCSEIGSKLGLTQREALKPFTMALVGHGYSSHYDPNIAEIINTIENPEHVTSYNLGNMESILYSLNNTSRKDGITLALNHITKEQPDLKDSADYMASELSKAKELLTEPVFDTIVDRQGLGANKLYTYGSHVSLITEVQNTLERAKYLGVDADKLADALIANDFSRYGVLDGKNTLSDVISGVDIYTPMYVALSVKLNKTIEELLDLSDDQLRNLAEPYAKKFSLDSLIKLHGFSYGKDYKIAKVKETPEFKEGIQHFLNATGFELMEHNDGDPSKSKKLNLKEIDTDEILQMLRGDSFKNPTTNTERSLKQRSDLSTETKTLFSNLALSARVRDALGRVRRELDDKSKGDTFMYDPTSDNCMDRLPTISIKDRSSLIEKAQRAVESSSSTGSSSFLKDALNAMSPFRRSIEDTEPEALKILRDSMQALASYSVKLNTNKKYNTDDKRTKFVDELIGYGISKPAISSAELKELREKALSKCNCTLKTADQATYDSVDHKVKQDWDKGELGSNGRRLYSYISFVNHGVYHINNSVAEERFNNAVQSTDKKNGYDSTPNDPSRDKCYFDKSVHSLYHGTDFRGGCGILGVDGKFRDYREAQAIGQKTAGAMLGHGTYLADLAGKSAGYFGDWGKGYNKRGALLICDAVLGNQRQITYRNKILHDQESDTIFCQKGTYVDGKRRLRANEWCVRNSSLIFPRMIIDAESKER